MSGRRASSRASEGVGTRDSELHAPTRTPARSRGNRCGRIAIQDSYRVARRGRGRNRWRLASTIRQGVCRGVDARPAHAGCHSTSGLTLQPMLAVFGLVGVGDGGPGPVVRAPNLRRTVGGASVAQDHCGKHHWEPRRGAGRGCLQGARCSSCESREPHRCWPGWGRDTHRPDGGLVFTRPLQRASVGDRWGSQAIAMMAARTTGSRKRLWPKVTATTPS